MMRLLLIPVAIYVILLAGSLIARRGRIRVKSDGTIDGKPSGPPPTGEPIASLKGGARIGGMAVSYPFAVLDLHESALVVRSPQHMFSPVSIRRDAVGSLRVTRRPVGAALKLFDENGRAYDVLFQSFSTDQLRGTLASAGWLVLLE